MFVHSKSGFLTLSEKLTSYKEDSKLKKGKKMKEIFIHCRCVVFYKLIKLRMIKFTPHINFEHTEGLKSNNIFLETTD